MALPRTCLTILECKHQSARSEAIHLLVEHGLLRPTVWLVGAYHPSSTILPRDVPVSKSACARLRLKALMVPKILSSVVRSTPLSMRSATSLSRWPCALMSGVWNAERVAIDSQWTEIDLPLKTATANSGASSIRANLPWGAMNSAIAL